MSQIVWQTVQKPKDIQFPMMCDRESGPHIQEAIHRKMFQMFA